MKTLAQLVIFVLISISVYAEDGHHFWLRNSSTKSVNVVCTKNSQTLTIAKQELQNGWIGEMGTSVNLVIKADKAIRGDGFRIVQQVRQFQQVWNQVERFVDRDRFADVQKRLRDQSLNALEWKDACLLHFQKFSRKPIPYNLERPMYNLDYLIEKDTKRVGDYQH